MKKVVTVAIFLFSLSAIAFAQSTPAPMPMAASGSNLSTLQYFAGSWDCKGTAMASAMAPEHATKARVKAEWTLDRSWLELSYKEEKTSANKVPVAVRIFWGYDGELKQLVQGELDNRGGYATGASSGWDGDKLVWEGPLHAGGVTMKMRDLFTKKSATEVLHEADVEMNGAWQKVDEQTCWKK